MVSRCRLIWRTLAHLRNSSQILSILLRSQDRFHFLVALFKQCFVHLRCSGMLGSIPAGNHFCVEIHVYIMYFFSLLVR